MAKVGNEIKLVLSLAKERMGKLRDSRARTANSDYCLGYDRAYTDWLMTLDSVVAELETK